MNKFEPMKPISGDFELKAEPGAVEYLLKLVKPHVLVATLSKEVFNLVPRGAVVTVTSSLGGERFFKIYRRDSKTCKLFGREIKK